METFPSIPNPRRYGLAGLLRVSYCFVRADKHRPGSGYQPLVLNSGIGADEIPSADGSM